MEAKSAAKDDKPVLSKEMAPFVTAFLNGWFDVLCFKQYKAFTLRQTGSTMNSAINVVTGDIVNIRFFIGVLVHYCGGCALMRFLDIMFEGRARCAAAPVVLALQSANDKLCQALPQAKSHMWLLAMSNGIFNTAFAEKLGCLTHVITGHYQKVSTDLVAMAMKNMTHDERRTMQRGTIKSALVLLAFFAGSFMGQAGGDMKHSLVGLCSKQRFGILGIFYAATLVLSEVPKNRIL
mmetsp:Transcript_105359/g.186595  ORF Transcript_105359/g.186595 Transcript_105359/m.186595 type:complete len:236 (+) Transcript_105359:80-787(+)